MTTRKQALNDLADVFEKHDMVIDGSQMDLFISEMDNDLRCCVRLDDNMDHEDIRNLANQQEERDGDNN